MAGPMLGGLPDPLRRGFERFGQAERFGRRATGTGLVRAPDEDPDFKLVDLDDLLLAAPRGIEGLIRSIADLPSILPGIDTHFSDRRLLGRSDTLVGGLLEGVSQFVVPFGLATKALGVAGGLARARNLGVIGRAVTNGLFGSSLGRALVAGAVADFTAFGAHEQRLSNVIQDIPGLSDVLPDFLAAEEDDSEIEGRLKNVLEGLALGGITDVLPAVLKGFRAGKRALESGASAEQLLGVIEARTVDADDALRKMRHHVAKEGSDDDIFLARKERSDALGKAANKKLRQAVKAAGGDATAPKWNTTRSQAEVIAEVKRRAEITPEETALALSEGYRLLNATDGNTLSLLGGKIDEVPKEVVEMLGLAETDRLNLKGLTLEADEVAVIRGLEQIISGITAGSKRTETEVEMAARALPTAADILDMDAAAQVRFFDDMRQRGADFRERMVATAVIMPQAVNDVFDALDRVDFDRGTGLEIVQGALSALERYRVGLRGGAEEAGRTLRARQLQVSSELMDEAGRLLDDARSGRLFTKLGKAEAKRRIDQVAFYRQFNPSHRTGALARFAEMDGLQRSVAMTNEVLVNNLLSSPKSVVSNFLFPLMQSVYLPLEAMLGGAVTAGFGKITGKTAAVTGGLEVLYREMDNFAGMFRAISDSVHYGRVASREAKPRLTGSARELPRESLLRQAPETFKLITGHTPGATLSRVLSGFGKFMTWASPIMTGVDEGIGQMTARGYVWGELMGEARRMGLGRAEALAHANEGLDKAFLHGQLLSDETVHLRATRRVLDRGFQEGTPGFRRALASQIKEEFASVDYKRLQPITEAALARAHEARATTPLSGLSRSVEEVIQRHPMLKIVFPFFRTPTNLAGQSLERASLGLPAAAEYLMRSSFGRKSVPIENLRLRMTRDFVSGDPKRVAEAVGRISAGAGFAALAGSAAMAGVMTGGGPKDPQQRKLLESTGWQPYSIKVGDGYVQYLRADPLAAMLGIYADMVDTARFADPDETDFDVASSALIMSISQNITNKTYMQGLRMFVDAWTKGEEFSANWISRSITSLVVPRSIQSLSVLTDDPVLRDANGILETIRSRTPFLSDGVPPQRNVLGEPIRRSLAVDAEAATPATTWLDIFLPIAYREVKDDIVNTEFRRLSHGFVPPSRRKSGVRVDDYVNSDGRDAYDRWGELQGKVRIGDRTLKQALRDLVQSEGYRSLPDDIELMSDRPQVRAISQVISRYREAAWEQTLTEYPQMERDVRAYFIRRQGKGTQPNQDNPFVRFGR